MTALADWNLLPEGNALTPVLACCGSRAFAGKMIASRPFADIDSLLTAADALWWSLTTADWLEAFACHPRIGESPQRGSPLFARWSSEEQATARDGAAAIMQSIAAGNREYERRHGFLYIVCASGRSAAELLAVLERRIGNSTEVEIQEAAENQRQITQIRLRKWLMS